MKTNEEKLEANEIIKSMIKPLRQTYITLKRNKCVAQNITNLALDDGY
jgi:hypothetical protein